MDEKPKNFPGELVCDSWEKYKGSVIMSTVTNFYKNIHFHFATITPLYGLTRKLHNLSSPPFVSLDVRSIATVFYTLYIFSYFSLSYDFFPSIYGFVSKNIYMQN